MDRTVLYRQGTAAESLNPVYICLACSLQDFPNSSSSPRGGAALNRLKCPTRTMASSRVRQREVQGYRYGGRPKRRWGKGKKYKTAKRHQWARVLLGNHRLPFAVLIYMKIYLVYLRVPGCCCSCCDSNQSGMWRCKFLPHLISLLLSLQAIVLIQIIYFTVSAVIHCYHLPSYSAPSFLLFYGSYLYATLRHSADHVGFIFLFFIVK